MVNKTLFPVFIWMTFSTALLGQNTIELTFSAEYICSHVPLDSIHIRNITQGADTVLYNPDTVLTLTTTGVSMQNTDVTIFAITGIPNPFSNSTSIHLTVPQSGKVHLVVSNISGREFAMCSQQLRAGLHKFILQSVPNGFYIVSAICNEARITTQLLCISNENQGSPTLNYVGSGNDIMTNKTTQSEFMWSPGDELQYIGYATSEILISDTIYASPYSDESYVFDFMVIPVFQCGCPFTDLRDGSIYRTAKIGSQCWMAENLRYLPSVTGPETISVTEAFIYVYGYDGNDLEEAMATENYQIYGALYNWAAAMNGEAPSNNTPSGVTGICPSGWHLPSHNEITELERAVCTSSHCETSFPYNETTWGWRGDNEGAKLAGVSELWAIDDLVNDPDFGSSGFEMTPSGMLNNENEFVEITRKCRWWATTQQNPNGAWGRSLSYSDGTVFRASFDKKIGISVRCIKD